MKLPETIYIVQEKDERDDTIWYNVVEAPPSDKHGQTIGEYKLVRAGKVAVVVDVEWKA